MELRRPVALFTALFFTLVSVSARAQCSKDTDCKGERVCEAGQCVAGLPPAPDAPPGSAAPAAPAPAPASPAPAPAPAAPVAPAAAAPAKPPMKRNSPAMMALGIVMVAAAPVVWVSAAMTSICTYPETPYDSGCGNGTTAVALTMVGFGLLGAGIPLIVIGAKKVPDTDPVPATATLSPWATSEGAGATLRVDL